MRTPKHHRWKPAHETIFTLYLVKSKNTSVDLKKLLLIKILMVKYVKKQSQNKRNEGDEDVQEQVLPVTLIYIVICPIVFTQMPATTGKGYIIGRYFS